MMEYFIDHANYKDKEIYFPNIGLLALKRGQHVFSAMKIAEKLGVSRQSVRSKLKILKNIKFLTIQTTNRFSIASVTNYDIYQPQDGEINQQANLCLTSSQPAANQQLTTPNKDKKDNKEKNKETSPADADLIKKINDISEQLYRSKKFLKVHTFKNKMLKDEKNHSALYHVLCQLQKSPKVTDNYAWAWCAKIMGVESGNFNEAEYRERAEKQKRELEKFADEMGAT